MSFATYPVHCLLWLLLWAWLVLSCYEASIMEASWCVCLVACLLSTAIGTGKRQPASHAYGGGSLARVCVSIDAANDLRFANYYGDHMVLQRAPASAIVWGYEPDCDDVSVAFNGATVKADLIQGDSKSYNKAPSRKF